MRESGSKSGNPCAKLIARSGPCSERLRRVISRMTDSVNDSALCESRMLVPGISSLQDEVGARARVAAHRSLEASLPPPADAACPPRLGVEVEHVGAAEEADHLAPTDDRHAPDALSDQESSGLVDAGLLRDRDDAWAHDLARRLSLLGENVGFGDDAHDVAFVGDHRRARDVLGAQRPGDLLDRRVLTKRDHVSRHHFLDRDHRRSVATVCRLALPPLSTRPVRPTGSLPARKAASGRVPVGSSARCSRDQATRSASAISSSVTVTIWSTSRWANITSKLRSPMAVVRTPSARVAGEAGRVSMLPAFQLR